MTLVRFRIRQGDKSLVSGRSIFASPYRRVVDSDGITVPSEFQIPLTGVPVIVDVPVLPTGWAWRFRETVPEGTTTYKLVPASGSTLNYEQLTDVDPATLAPTAAPEAAWWAALEEAILGAGGTVVAASITDATTLGRSVLTAPDQDTALAALDAIPASSKGQPGGVARYDGDGDLINVAGDKVTGQGATSVDQLTDATSTGRALATAVTPSAARTTLGVQNARIDFLAVGGVYPPRPATTQPLRFATPGVVPTTDGWVNVAPDGTVTAGGGMVIGLDTCILAAYVSAP